MESSLAGINEAHKAGLFSRFGLANYPAKDVENICEHCKAHNYVLPTAYQGNYSAIARRLESELFPTLRKYGIAFYAYSPLAGGFLTKTKQDIADEKGRFVSNTTLGQLYRLTYAKPAYLEALSQWEDIAKEAGVSRAELAYRWMVYSSPLKAENGDAMIFGASSLNQAKQTLEGVGKGPLDGKVVDKVEKLWKTVEHEAPVENYVNEFFNAGV